MTIALIEDALERVKETVRLGKAIEAAQVQIIGLGDVRVAAGPKWESIRERVRSLSQSFLRGCISEEDILIPCGDDFLLVFANPAIRDIAKERSTLRDALNAFFIDEKGMEGLQSAVRPVDAQGATTLMTQATAGLSTCPHRFLPVWSVAREIVASHYVMPTSYIRGARFYGYDPKYREAGAHMREDYADLDLAGFELAEAAVTANHKSGRTIVVGYNVHSTTLRNPLSRRRFLDRVQAAPKQAQKHLVARIAEIEAGTPLSRISEWVSLLRVVCKNVSIELHRTERALADIGSIGVWCVSTSLPVAEPITPSQHHDALTTAHRWSLALHKQGLKFSVENIEARNVLRAVCQADVDFASSHAVWPARLEPGGVAAFRRDEL